MYPEDRLTVHLNDGRTPSLIVRDRFDVSVRQIFLDGEVVRYVFRSRHLHEISLREGHKLLLRLDRCDANASVFSDAIEAITRRLSIFSSEAQARDSDGSGSGSGSDDESGPPGTMAAAAPVRLRIQSMWDCTVCDHANHPNQMLCGECSRYRNDAWQCSCSRIYRLEKRKCAWCDIWRCHRCTFLNEATSPDRCYGCGSSRNP